jgi:phage gpG-like protein
MPTRFGVEIDSFGFESVEREFKSNARRAANLGDTFRKIADYIRKVNEQQFDTEGGGTWAPLDFDTVREKQRQGQDPRILHASLRLRDSLTIRNHPDQVVRVTKFQLYFASDVPYGRFHAEGTSEMPQRKPMEFSPARLGNISRMLKQGIIGRKK